MNKFLRKRYFIFILTVSLAIIANGLILEYNLRLQDTDAVEINIAGRQRMLSQKITKYIFYIENGSPPKANYNPVDSLSKYISEFVRAHKYLNKTQLLSDKAIKMDSLFHDIEEPLQSIVSIGNIYVKNDANAKHNNNLLNTLTKKEYEFLSIMEKIVSVFQKNAEIQLSKTKKISIILSIISLLLLLGEYLFLIKPSFDTLVQNNGQLKTANRKLTDFANITSHNLRAPLGNLRTLLIFLKNSDEEEDRALLINKLNVVSNRMDETMNILLDAVSIQKSSAQIEKKVLKFESVLNHIKEDLSSQLNESGAIVTEDFKNTPDINYAPIYLESVMLNLMTNSIKFRDTVRPLKINISTTKKEDKTILIHSDNGRGLDMKRHGDKLFGMNKVFHKNTDSKGIGLFMTRMQIESMGGTITAKSKPDEGMTFIIEF